MTPTERQRKLQTTIVAKGFTLVMLPTHQPQTDNNQLPPPAVASAMALMHKAVRYELSQWPEPPWTNDATLRNYHDRWIRRFHKAADTIARKQPDHRPTVLPGTPVEATALDPDLVNTLADGWHNHPVTEPVG